MRIYEVIWFLIIGIWAFSIFSNIIWFSHIVGPLLIGLFIILTNKKQVDDGNTFYKNMSKKVPFLFPPSWVGKTNYRFQRWITVLAGIGFIVFAFVNLLKIL